MKKPTKPKAYKHQQAALKKSRHKNGQYKEAFAFLMEMGTGKSRPTIETANDLHKSKDIEAMVVLAPNGVQRNWVLKELPKWCDVPYRAAWYESQPTIKRKQALDAVTARPYNGLRIITANFEQCVRLPFKAYLKKFLRSFKTLIVIDESTRIKTPKAARTKFIVSLRKHSSYRRILSGLVAPKSPFDIYKQFEFLDPDILGFGSFYAFKAHFAEMENNPRFLAAIQRKHAERGGAFRGTPRIVLSPYSGVITEIKEMKEFVSQGDTVAMVDHKYDIIADYAGTINGKNFKVGDRVCQGDKVIRIIEAPMLIKKDEDGNPKYKNLEELYKLIEPYSFRALKKDCLDLPDKIYGMISVELTDKQRSLYEQVRNEVVAEFDGKQMTQALAITRLLRLQQITGGFWVPDNAKRKAIPIDLTFPKLESIMEDIEDVTGKVAIWTHFQHENELIAKTLRDSYGSNSVVQYYGKISDDNKQIAVDRFSNIVRDKKGIPRDEDTGARFWVGEPHSGGIGLECVLAEYVYYYSNSYNLEDRLQSEDRHHRSGFREERNKWGIPHSVVFKDVEALESCDQVIINSLRSKKEVAHVIMGDGLIKWI